MVQGFMQKNLTILSYNFVELKFPIPLKCHGFSQFHGPWTQIKYPEKSLIRHTFQES